MFTKKKEGMYKRAKIFKECTKYPNISETAFKLLFFGTVISKKYQLPLENGVWDIFLAIYQDL